MSTDHRHAVLYPAVIHISMNYTEQRVSHNA